MVLEKQSLLNVNLEKGVLKPFQEMWPQSRMKNHEYSCLIATFLPVKQKRSRTTLFETLYDTICPCCWPAEVVIHSRSSWRYSALLTLAVQHISELAFYFRTWISQDIWNATTDQHNCCVLFRCNIPVSLTLNN